MSKTTITEALAEIPTIQKRIKAKQDFILGYLYRQSTTRDPHEGSGGSATLISRELQAIGDCNKDLLISGLLSTKPIGITILLLVEQLVVSQTG